MIVSFNNDTHWRSTDLKRIVRAAAAATNCEDIPIRVIVKWSGNPKALRRGEQADGTLDILLCLRRRGLRDVHRVPMMALALSSILPSGDETFLSFSDVFVVANDLAALFVSTTIERSYDRAFVDEIYKSAGKDIQPDWAPAETFIVQKYKDPKKDGTYQEFVARKEKHLRELEKSIEKAEGAVAELTARLKKLRARKATVERSLRDARKRRS